MDFTGMLMQDHYKAIADDRTRMIEVGRWRRAWFASRAPDAADHCCTTNTIASVTTVGESTGRAVGAA